MANNITKNEFLAFFDEFNRTPTDKVEAYIAVASYRVPPGVWLDRTKYATALLTAHMIASSGGAGGSGGSAGGRVSDESVGDLSRSYDKVGEAGAGDETLMTTRYGIMFVELRKEFVVAATVTSSGCILGSYG